MFGVAPVEGCSILVGDKVNTDSVRPQVSYKDLRFHPLRS